MYRASRRFFSSQSALLVLVKTENVAISSAPSNYKVLLSQASQFRAAAVSLRFPGVSKVNGGGLKVDGVLIDPGTVPRWSLRVGYYRSP